MVRWLYIGLIIVVDIVLWGYCVVQVFPAIKKRTKPLKKVLRIEYAILSIVWALTAYGLAGLVLKVKLLPSSWEIPEDARIPPQTVAAAWAAYFAFIIPRRIAAFQTGPKLLERFNSKDSFASRRDVWWLMLDWYSGDRLARDAYVLGKTLIGSANPRLNKDAPPTGYSSVGQVWGIIAELREYEDSELILTSSMRELFTDRFAWLAHYLNELVSESKNWLKSSSEITPQERHPASAMRGEELLEWLKKTFELDEFISAKRIPATTDDDFAENPPMREAWRIDGLTAEYTNLQEWPVIVELVGYPTLDGGRTTDAKDGFNRVRWSKKDGQEVRFILDQGSATPFRWSRRIVRLSDEEAAERYWRLRRQGATPKLSNPFEPDQEPKPPRAAPETPRSSRKSRRRSSQS